MVSEEKLDRRAGLLRWSVGGGGGVMHDRAAALTHVMLVSQALRHVQRSLLVWT